MAIPNSSEKSNSLDREENITKGNLAAKRVALFTYDSNTDTLLPYSAGASSNYETFTDTTTDVNLVYLGKAEPGTATSAASWQIKRYNKLTGQMSFADDITTFTKEWDDRATYSY